VCVCVGFVMCRCMCEFCNVWVCGFCNVCVCFVMCGCVCVYMCGFCNVSMCVCVCVGFGNVYTSIFLSGYPDRFFRAFS